MKSHRTRNLQNSSKYSVALFALQVSVLGFDVLLGETLPDIALLNAIGLGLNALLFYTSWERSWNRTA